MEEVSHVQKPHALHCFAAPWLTFGIKMRQVVGQLWEQLVCLDFT